MVAHGIHQAHPPDFYRFGVLEPVRKLKSVFWQSLIAKLKQHYEEAFIDLFGNRPHSGWLADRAPAQAQVRFILPPAVIASVSNAK